MEKENIIKHITRKYGDFFISVKINWSALNKIKKVEENPSE